MTLSMQQISDRLEINDLLAGYSYAIDFRDWDALDNVFTADAVIDYTEMGAPRGNLTETKAFLASVLPNFPSYQHMVATTKLTFDGDGNPHMMFCGLWYRDTFVRTPDGWRIKDRYEERSYLRDFPG